MGTVDVGVGHHDDAVIAQFLEIEVLADAGAQGRDKGPDFRVTKHLVEAGLFDVENLTFDGQNGLEVAVAALFGGAAGAIALDDEQFRFSGVAVGAVGQLAGHRSPVQNALAAHRFAGFARSFSSPHSVDGFFDDLLGRRLGFSSKNWV